jgi:F-type H+-transporting ATPase subunit b
MSEADRRSARLKSGVMVFFLALLLPSLALAGGEAGWSKIGWQAANLIILLAIIVRFGRKPIGKALRVRAEVISNEIDEASRLHAEAEALLETYRSKLSGLDDQVEAMMRQFKEAGEAEKAGIIAEGEAEAQRIREDAERTAQSEYTHARAQVQREVIEVALAVAEQSITDNLNSTDHRRLTAEYLGQLETVIRSS